MDDTQRSYFDIDGSVLGDITILGEFDHVFVPVLDGGYAEEKVAAFQRLLEKQELQKVVMRMQQVVVPDHAYDSAEMMQLAGRAGGDISPDDRKKLKEHVLEELDMSQEIIDEKVLELIDRSLLEHPDIGYVSLEGRIRLRKELFNAVRRMDVLSDLLEDDSITEIMINGYDQIFVEKDGRIQSFSQSFESEDRLASIIQQIVAGCNRLVNEAVPIVDARLPDGSRVNGGAATGRP